MGPGSNFTTLDVDGTIAQVEFFQGATLLATVTSAPYTFTLSNVAAGIYSFTAKATDNQGASTISSAVAVTVNALPTVSLTSPANGATFTAPATIAVTAAATDADGAVTRVDFYSNGNLIGGTSSPPYSVTLNGVAQDSYTLTAIATDNLGGASTSTPVTVTVNAAVAQIYYIHTDHLNTPRVIINQVGQAVWRFDNTDPFGSNVPDENPSGLGTFIFNLRFPGQYADKETNTHYNYFRDYDPAIGRYIQSDPIGIVGQLKKNSETAKLQHLLNGSYQLAKGGSPAQDIYALMVLGAPRIPETLLYGYTGNNPLTYTDPNGELGALGWTVIGAAIVGAVVGLNLYGINDCVKKCSQVCPIPATGDPVNDQSRAAWITKCQADCTKAFLGFLRKFGAPTPPVDLIISQ